MFCSGSPSRLWSSSSNSAVLQTLSHKLSLIYHTYFGKALPMFVNSKSNFAKLSIRMHPLVFAVQHLFTTQAFKSPAVIFKFWFLASKTQATFILQLGRIQLLGTRSMTLSYPLKNEFRVALHVFWLNILHINIFCTFLISPSYQIIMSICT